MPAINQETQTALLPAGLAESEADPGDLQGVLVRMGVLGTFVPVCPKLPSRKKSNHKVKPQICQEELGREVQEQGPGGASADVLQVQFCHLLDSLISN